ncbi:MAG TPA: hypothetical protein VHV77_02170 [Pirellulales bacterium]|jgi:hypothetical protein|nr:hypothetical protein [Pirellulales bacterium]
MPTGPFQFILKRDAAEADEAKVRAVNPLASANADINAVDMNALDDECPVIYADRVYLGLAHPTRRLRVVCFETVSHRHVHAPRKRAG